MPAEPVVRRHADHEERSDEVGSAVTCPVVFVPRDPTYCPRCTCDRSATHGGHHHCPDCGVWYTLASDVERAP
jgi:hypothetical protein